MTKKQRPTLKEYVNEIYNVQHCTNAGLIDIISEYLETRKEPVEEHISKKETTDKLPEVGKRYKLKNDVRDGAKVVHITDYHIVVEYDDGYCESFCHGNEDTDFWGYFEEPTTEESSIVDKEKRKEGYEMIKEKLKNGEIHLPIPAYYNNADWATGRDWGFRTLVDENGKMKTEEIKEKDVVEEDCPGEQAAEEIARKSKNLVNVLEAKQDKSE